MSWDHVGHHLGPGRVASLSYLCAVIVLFLPRSCNNNNNGNYIGDLVIIDINLNLHPFVAVNWQASKPLEPNIAQLCSLVVSRVEFGVLGAFILNLTDSWHL